MSSRVANFLFLGHLGRIYIFIWCKVQSLLLVHYRSLIKEKTVITKVLFGNKTVVTRNSRVLVPLYSDC